MKSIYLLTAIVIPVLLAGCSNAGVEFSKEAQALAECTLAGKSNCNTRLSTGAEMEVERASLFNSSDSVRVSASLTSPNECVTFGKIAGNQKNSAVTINGVRVKLYGEEWRDSVKNACDDAGPFAVSLTVAKIQNN